MVTNKVEERKRESLDEDVVTTRQFWLENVMIASYLLQVQNIYLYKFYINFILWLKQLEAVVLSLMGHTCRCVVVETPKDSGEESIPHAQKSQMTTATV